MKTLEVSPVVSITNLLLKYSFLVMEISFLCEILVCVSWNYIIHPTSTSELGYKGHLLEFYLDLNNIFKYLKITNTLHLSQKIMMYN